MTSKKAMPSSSTAAAAASAMDLEVTVMSGEEVTIPTTGRPLGRCAFAVVRTPAVAASTHIDEDSYGDCNGYPYWKEAVAVSIPAGVSGFGVEICRRRSSGRVETVAAAFVPVGDFTVGPPGHLHCLSYRLFNAGEDGCRKRRRNGIVNITVRRTDVKYAFPAAAAVPIGEGKKGSVSAAAAAMNGGASGSGGGSSCGAAAAPAGAAMGYPVGFTAGKACV
uniref:C2 domain-containing protein n=1 Tax=Leersia perrieri TaxID=77586 RepID=A0A0D9XFV5_9ORYZ